MRRSRRTLGARSLLVMALVGGIATAAPVAAASPQVLRVGTYNGIPGQFTSIQAAVNAAHSGDWILVGPGDYHEQGVSGADEPAGVLVTTNGLHLRGMDRNRVVVDGTKPGSPQCSGNPNDQQITDKGLNGIDGFKADGGYVENLTVCNYLTNKDGEEG